MENIIEIHGEFRKDDTVSFKAVKTIYNGTGSMDYKQETIAAGVTEKAFTTDDCDEDAFNYFQEKYAQEGFEFDCFID